MERGEELFDSGESDHTASSDTQRIGNFLYLFAPMIMIIAFIALLVFSGDGPAIPPGR
jgi:hypothetical protein